MYVITGATGNTGKIVTQNLLKEGKKVRVISRNKDKAQELVDMGAELFLGNTSDVNILKEVFHGATAVYALIPGDWIASDYTAHQVKHAEAIAEAVKATGVKHVVSLSSVGAHLEKDSGIILGLHKMEELFNKIPDLNVLHLRPSYFMENTLGMIGLIMGSGIMGGPVKPDFKFPIIAAKDIGFYASKRMLKLDFKGNNVQHLLGARDVSYPEIARVFGQAIGKPDLQYVEFSYEDFGNSMVNQMGASQNVADNFVTFLKSFNEGKITEIAKRDAESTTPTTIEEFAKTFAYVYNLQN